MGCRSAAFQMLRRMRTCHRQKLRRMDAWCLAILTPRKTVPLYTLMQACLTTVSSPLRSPAVVVAAALASERPKVPTTRVIVQKAPRQAPRISARTSNKACTAIWPATKTALRGWHSVQTSCQRPEAAGPRKVAMPENAAPRREEDSPMSCLKNPAITAALCQQRRKIAGYGKSQARSTEKRMTTSSSSLELMGPRTCFSNARTAGILL
mmetsp:Transcript_61252/g.154610  ORF Transcript_61252/g.154610 Transcript_61252/m.154610 type:complete len:209 (-) Transcript_61252:621-1247(-)